MSLALSSEQNPRRPAGWGSALAVVLAFALALVLGLVWTACSERETPVFGLYAVWVAGSNDANREELDRFLDCLIEGSTLNQYWGGEARIELRGSYALEPPAARLEWDQLATEWLAPQVGMTSGLPVPNSDEIPLYLIFGGRPDVWTGSCGRNSEVTVAGRLAGVGIVRNNPLCWKTGDRLRTETQIATHEIVETVDRVLGYGTCAAGGTCRGRGICEGYCDSFVGLQCPGAPTGSYTGCDNRQIDGWVIQKLGYAGRDPARCDECMECDFTPQVH
ncbi:MAG: hypothetical protein ACPG4T_19380 [Nannocystaceae bacterium]